MPITFDETYFNDGSIGYKNYSNNLRFYQRAEWLSKLGFDHITILGCAYGYTIKHLIEDFNFTNVKGIEKSKWAVDKATELGLAPYIYPLDAIYYDYIDTDLIVSWNVMDTLSSEDEALTIANYLNLFKKTQIHILSMSDSPNTQEYIDMGYFMKPYSYWRSLFPNAYLVCWECKKVYLPTENSPSIGNVPLSSTEVAN